MVADHVPEPALSLGLVLVALTALNVPAGAGDEMTVTFEDLAPRTRVGSAESGVTFSAGVEAVDFSNMPGFAHSGTIAVEQCYATEFCNSPFVMTFAEPQGEVSLWVGDPLQRPGTLTLTAYDEAGKQITSKATRLEPAAQVTPINISLAVSSDGKNNIASTSLAYNDTGGLPDGFAVDDVAFRTVAPAPSPDLAVGPVTHRSTNEGRTLVLTVHVENRGGGRSKPSSLRGSVVGWMPVAPAAIPELAPGKASDLPFLFGVPDSARGIQVTVHLQIDPIAEESARGNNERDVSITTAPPSNRTHAPAWGGIVGGVLGGAAALGLAAYWVGRRRWGRGARIEVEATAGPSLEHIEWQLKATDKEPPKHCTEGKRICHKECEIEPARRVITELSVKHLAAHGEDLAVRGEVVGRLNDARKAHRRRRPEDVARSAGIASELFSAEVFDWLEGKAPASRSRPRSRAGR